MMNCSSSQITKLTLVIFAVAMVFCAALPGSFSEATSADRTARHHESNDADNSSLILFKRGAFDTRTQAHFDTASTDALTPSGAAHGESAQTQTRIIQFAGPIKRKWMERLKATGAEVVGYVPNNAYVIRGSTHQLAEVATLNSSGLSSDEDRPVRWMGRFQPIQKIDSAYDDGMLYRGGANVDVEIELVDSPEATRAIDFINNLTVKHGQAPRHFLSFIVLSVTVPAGRLLDIAGFDEVLFIGPLSSPQLHDECAAQISAGNLGTSRTEPIGPGYREWLTAKGLNTRPDFVIDFTDTGIDSGSTSAPLVHPDFLDAEGHSRIAYSINYTRDSRADDSSGHGTLVASIAGGSGMSGRVDSAGYLFGLGVEPHAMLGTSRIFSDGGALPFQLSFSNVASSAYTAGARVSNNSWGNGGNSYDATAQEYDALVRDAQPAVPGNQEMTFIFSAGNNGEGGRISSPGTAKNVITVAASENVRPEGFDSCNLDGGGVIGPEGADSALDILRFSSGGPTKDGRAKPDIAAPGTHIFGAASQSHFFNGNGLCPGITRYQPPGQGLYTWSSGTSLAAPHVSGAAALVRKFFTLNNLLGGGQAPSPAMIKAYIINSATYMTGEHAGGNLPDDRQGWGLLNLGQAFDNARRVLVDQTHRFTESGQTFEIKGSVADRTHPLRLTLAWTDAPGTLAGGTLVNDLDLEIAVGDAIIYRGNNFMGELSTGDGAPDKLNNVESIFIPVEAIPEGVAGNFTITVRASNIAGDGVPGNGDDLDQDFALVVYNIADPIKPEPPKKTPVITNASYIKKRLTITGQDFTRDARVEINSKIIEREFAFDAATNSLSIKKNRQKLNLNKGADNEIVILEKGERSIAFNLKL